PARVENHRQALARALRMPDHPAAPVARCVRRLDSRFDSLVDGVELMVAGDFLANLAGTFIFEDDKVAEQAQEATLIKDAFDYHLQLRHRGWREGFAVDRAPGHEALPIGSKRANSRLDAVGDDHQLVPAEQ